LRQQVWPLLENGSVKAIIDSVFPLASAELAHQRLISGQHFGKIILEI
jgi:NADPH:quinone reductase-like Zn-dependent oxidoreductase